MPAHEWLDRKAAAAYLTISERTLTYLTDVGKKLRPRERIPSHLIGRRRLYRRDELDEFASRPPPPVFYSLDNSTRRQRERRLREQLGESGGDDPKT